MGIFSSKVDTSHLETIEANVVDLIIRTSEEQGKIDQYVKNQILKALGIYSEHIKNVEGRGYISYQKALKMKELTTQAMKNLEALPSKSPSSHTDKKYESPYEMRNYIFNVEKKLKHITDEDCKSELETVIRYSQNLKKNHTNSLTEEQEDRISVLLLKLFLKSKVTKASNILSDTLSTLECVTENSALILLDKITAYDIETVICNLKKIDDRLEELSRKTKKSITKLETQYVKNSNQKDHFHHCHGKGYTSSTSLATSSSMISQGSSTGLVGNENYQYRNVFKQVEEDLDRYKKIVEKLSVPISKVVINTIREKIFELIKSRLDSIPKDCCTARTRKKQSLFDRGMGIINKLTEIDEENKEISENLKVLKDIEEDIHSIDSNLAYQETKYALHRFLERANQIKHSNREVQIQKTEIVNKIEGLLFAETMFYLRNIKKSVEQYKVCARQFAYPEWVKESEVKFEEIYSLKNSLELVPKENNCVKDRIDMINKEIDETLNIFKDKVASNGNILRLLNNLENVVNKINSDNSIISSRSQKLKIFNKTRKMVIENISNNNHRLCGKKREILCQLHNLEQDIYTSKYPEQLKQMKVILDDYEKVAQHISYQLLPIQEYQEKIQKLYEIRQNVERIYMHQMDDSYMNVFFTNIYLVLELLRAVIKALKDYLNKNEELNRIKDQVVINLRETNFPKQIETLEKYQKAIKMLKTDGNDELLHAAEAVETMVAVERSKIELAHMNQILQNLQKSVIRMSRPISAVVFRENLEQVFTLKECVDDMPIGNLELDTQKQNFLKELFIILKNLDEDVFNFVAKKKHPENILALQKHFNDFDPYTTGVSKNSTEFIQIIQKRTESFEDRIKNYLGTNSSVEYYVIHENLMRLLEELDKLSCVDNDGLLHLTIEPMAYIRKLIDELNFNACNE